MGKMKRNDELFDNPHLSLRGIAGVYVACIRSVLLYGSETWLLGETVESSESM